MPRGHPTGIAQNSTKLVPEAKPVLILSIRLESGHFESNIRIPFDGPQEDYKEYLVKWHELMEMGIKLGLLELDAYLKQENKS